MQEIQSHIYNNHNRSHFGGIYFRISIDDFCHFARAYHCEIGQLPCVSVNSHVKVRDDAAHLQCESKK